MHRGIYMKDGGMARDQRSEKMPVKDFKHGAKETIMKGPERSPPKSDGMHGDKMMPAEKRSKMAMERAPGFVKITHVFHHKGRA